MNGVILSHTRMATHGICTTLAIETPAGLRQIRPRLPPNEGMQLGTFRYNAALMQEHWQPGRVVRFDGFEEIPAEHRRTTHPEDVYMTNPKGAGIFRNERHDPAALAQLVAPFTYATLDALYPHMRTQSNDKAYTLPNVVNPASVGYVRCTVRLEADEYAAVYDETGRVIRCKVKDETRLPLIRNGQLPVGMRFANVLVRFSLAGAYLVEWLDEERCYVMLSHIVG